MSLSTISWPMVGFLTAVFLVSLGIIIYQKYYRGSFVHPFFVAIVFSLGVGLDFMIVSNEVVKYSILLIFTYLMHHFYRK
jgi:hypothetical protein